MKRLQDDFHFKVASLCGLSLNVAKKLSPTDEESIENQVLVKLKSDPVMQSKVFPFVRDAIHKDPLPYAQILGIELALASHTKTKSFVDC